MSFQNYEEIKGNASATGNPNSYSETQSYQECDPLKLPVRPPPPMGYGVVPPPKPPPYQSSSGTPDTQMSQEPDFQFQQGIFITPVQPTKEPDSLIYSIFTLIFCFLPLGVAALIFSIKTQEANRNGNVASAQKNSRLARIMAHTSFGIGILFWVLFIIILAV